MLKNATKISLKSNVHGQGCRRSLSPHSPQSVDHLLAEPACSGQQGGALAREETLQGISIFPTAIVNTPRGKLLRISSHAPRTIRLTV